MTACKADLAETRYVDGTSARFAYRRLGTRSEPPLVLCLRRCTDEVLVRDQEPAPVHTHLSVTLKQKSEI